MKKYSLYRWLKCAVCGKRFKKEEKKRMLAFDGPPGIYRNIYVHRDKCLDEFYSKTD